MTNFTRHEEFYIFQHFSKPKTVTLAADLKRSTLNPANFNISLIILLLAWSGQAKSKSLQICHLNMIMVAQLQCVSQRLTYAQAAT